MNKISAIFHRVLASAKTCCAAVAAWFQKAWRAVARAFQSALARIFPGKNRNSPAQQSHPDNSKSARRQATLSNEYDASEEVGESTVVFTKTEELRRMDHGGRNQAPLSIDPAELRGIGKSPTTLFKPRDKKPLFAIGLIITTVKIAGIALVAFLAVCIGAVLGVANAYLGTTPELDLVELSDQNLTSYIYDCNGELITTYTGSENREYATLDEIPKNLQNAVIAVEDVRFYYHNGVDLKRLLGSFVSNMSGGNISGGSTITQQLIKNQLLTSERSYKRKIQEASLAIQLEQTYTKDQILEAYLNTISLGGINYGVKAAAKDYFGKELDELTLRECACIAGITQYPWAYNPRRVYYVTKDTSSLDARTNLVLERMYTAEYITYEEYQEALNDTLVVNEFSQVTEMYEMPHFVEYAIHDVVTQLLESRGLEDTTQNRSTIENELMTKGYHIYTTVDPEIQNTVQETFENYDDYPALALQSDNVITQTNSDGSVTEIIQPQVSTVIIDNETGYLKAVIGSRTTPTTRQTINRAYQSKMPIGSTIKPIAVYGPALDNGAGLGTVIANIPTRIDGWNTEAGYPTTSYWRWGPVTIRQAIVHSINNAAARVITDITTVDTAYEYLVKLGVSEDGLQKDGVGLALGSSGICTLELTAAYACIANGGVYREPLSFTEVRDSQGNVILSAEDVQDTYRVFKESTAFMLLDAMEDAVSSGTGTRAQISGMTVAGKTGTVLENRGATFAGITPYYTSALWVGHDNFKAFRRGSDGGRVVAPLWREYMSQLVEGLEDRPIMEGSASDYGLQRYTVCGVSGMRTNSYCSSDAGGHTPISDYFVTGTQPTETCNMHVAGEICTESGMLPSEYCPTESIVSGSMLVIPEDSDWADLDDSRLQSILGNVIRLKSNEVCDIHTAEWAESQGVLQEAIASLSSAISSAQSLLSNYSSLMTSSQISQLNSLIASGTALVSSTDPSALSQIQSVTASINNAVESIAGNLTQPSATPAPTPAATPAPTASSSVTPTPTPAEPSAEPPASAADDIGNGVDT